MTTVNTTVMPYLQSRSSVQIVKIITCCELKTLIKHKKARLPGEFEMKFFTSKINEFCSKHATGKKALQSSFN